MDWNKLNEDFYSAAKSIFLFYLTIFLCVLLLTAATLFFLIYKEKKETKEILVHIHNNYPAETSFVVQRGYYQDCSGSIVNKKEFTATVELLECKGVKVTRTEINLRDIDNKVYKFWLKHPFFFSDLILG